MSRAADFSYQQEKRSTKDNSTSMVAIKSNLTLGLVKVKLL